MSTRLVAEAMELARLVNSRSAVRLAVSIGLVRDRRKGREHEPLALDRLEVAADPARDHALRQVAEVSAELGSHLDKSVRTGTYCSYSPDRATRTRQVRPARAP